MASATLAQPNEDNLQAANILQMEIIRAGDPERFAEFLHPNFIVNSPINRCGTRDDVLRLFGSGALAHEKFERHVEAMKITGNIGIVMGKEFVLAAEGSPLAEPFGGAPLERRFTDIYLFEDGGWKFLARQASVIREPAR